jgi:hypothetical protein
VNNTITVQVNIPLNSALGSPLPFNFWAVGISGDDHINVYNSSLSGMTSQVNLVPAVTSIGTSSNNKFDLCASASYQSILVSTTTTTSYQSATSTTLLTSTYVVTTINSQVLFSNSANWPMMLLFLLVPAGLLMGATKSLSGALVGLMIGAVIGIMAGILPSWLFIGLVIAVASLAFVVRERNT